MRLAVRIGVFALVAPGTVVAWAPLFMVAKFRLGYPSMGPLSLASLLLMGLGLAMLAWCVWEFAHRGQGTPAPIDPPKHLVISGLYRYVRNPMYVAVTLILVGESVLWRTSVLAIYAACVFLAFNLFVLLYEEPTLRRQFGQEYEHYCASVPRWIPHFITRHRDS